MRKMRNFLFAKVKKSKEFEVGSMGLVLDDFLIIRGLKFLSEQVKRELLDWYLETRRDRFLILFENKIGEFKPNDVEIFFVDN